MCGCGHRLIDQPLLQQCLSISDCFRMTLIHTHDGNDKYHHTQTFTELYLSPSFRAPTNSSTVVHLLPLPHQSKAEAVRLRWTQEAPQGPEGYESCWGLDNVLLVNAAHRAPLMEDNLDPPDTANWLFFPGATVKVHWLTIGHLTRSLLYTWILFTNGSGPSGNVVIWESLTNIQINKETQCN